MGRRLHDWFLDTWYGGGGRGRWLAPLAWAFAVLARLRRWAYECGLLGRHRSRRPVVVVGNLTVGGTGKTPFVIWLAGELARRKLRVGVALRGYRGAGGDARLVNDSDAADSVGDEAVMVRRRLRMPVAVAARRVDAVRLLEPDCDVILCDDGLQHYALERDLEIVVVDGARGFGNGRLLPAGPLREPISRIEEADAVVVNGAGFERAGAIRMSLEPAAVVGLGDAVRRPLSDFSGQQVVAAAAIGHPERFFGMLKAHGLVVERRTLPDHARFTPETAGVGRGKPVLLTEKDAVKCVGTGWNGAAYVEVAPVVDAAAAEALVAAIVRAAHERGDGA
jgi:tetraacyldisaccharide 4'-kinase